MNMLIVNIYIINVLHTYIEIIIIQCKLVITFYLFIINILNIQPHCEVVIIVINGIVSLTNEVQNHSSCKYQV